MRLLETKEFGVYPEVKGKPVKSVKQKKAMFDSLLRNILAMAWRRGLEGDRLEIDWTLT